MMNSQNLNYFERGRTPFIVGNVTNTIKQTTLNVNSIILTINTNEAFWKLQLRQINKENPFVVRLFINKSPFEVKTR